MDRRPVIVVGAGIAGLSVALSMRRPVLLVTRGQVGGSGATPHAQGGIAAAWLPQDSSHLHLQDTMAAGGGVNAPDAARFLTDSARDAIHWLVAQGVLLDRDGEDFALCLEGGHSFPRVLHAGGDCSGRQIVEALKQRAAANGHIRFREGVDVEGLLTTDGRASGVQLRRGDGGIETVDAAAVVLATGGIGALFQCTTNPPESDGSGLALAMAVGAEMESLELLQFHPTALCTKTASETAAMPLISEAVRGAGGFLVDDAGMRVMAGIHRLQDLAPRDVVAREVWRTRQSGRSVFLDARCVGNDWPPRFPTVFASCMRAGIDPRTACIPVTAAAHFHMGGIRTDLDGCTSVAGLYAVGEVACNGVHGANRLASNSLLEGVVFGRRLGALLDADRRDMVHREGVVHRVDPLPRWLLSELRYRLWAALGPERDPVDMAALASWLEDDAALRSSGQGQLALAMVQAATARTESIGAHYVVGARREGLSVPFPRADY